MYVAYSTIYLVCPVRLVPISTEFYLMLSVDVDVNERLVQVMLYDTAGQDALDPLRRLSYPDCNVFLLCFSVVQPESFHAIERKWAPKFRHTNATMVLVGTQTDLRFDSKTIAKLKVRSVVSLYAEEAHGFTFYDQISETKPTSCCIGGCSQIGSKNWRKVYGDIIS